MADLFQAACAKFHTAPTHCAQMTCQFKPGGTLGFLALPKDEASGLRMLIPRIGMLPPHHGE